MPAKKAPLLEISGLTVERDSATLLRDIHWRIEPGQHWVLLGANGSGKTTLLKVLNGYTTATRGRFSVLGRTYGECDWRELRAHLGLVSNSLIASIPDAELPWETALSGTRGQLNLWGRVTRAEQASARRALRKVGLDHLADRPWAYLSQGERQRVLIARALLMKPRLLILDEPCSGLDPIARETFLHFINQLARRPRGPALILVTHHIEEIMPAFTHVYALRDGAQAASGEKQKILHAPILSQIFNAPLRLTRRDARHWLTPRL